ncbi:sugar transferase [Cecembia rubra]|uniref:Lipopolysaccharide/colanic/teichoic acid biosynthesis glycosyltransferase n=1 Tax=Cecembia rubra TaxID=1485585 RepID=A0A2P8EA32_9BACT|nr:sugar transferase [Cecembia rubra]PSL06325.1 lipopolysaccharide/colanic/teichoic acid biosynthesis glycosyltransferase [Cecembia rubra]
MYRVFDIILATIAVIILSPIFLIVIPILLLTGEHKVFYLQDRIGYKNQTFKIIKFATMLKNSPNLGTGSLTLRNDPRVLPFGKFLRKTKINELPQLFNVFLGDLSIVGPRPQMKVDFDKYPEDIKERIYDVRPGITGIGSIVFRDEEAFLTASKEDPHQYYANVIAPYKGELEMWYQKNKSFFLDIKIIFLTIWVIIFPESDFFKFLPGLPKKDL